MRSAIIQSFGALVAMSQLMTSVLAQISPEQIYQPPAASFGAVSQSSNLTNGVNPQYADLLGNALWFYEAQRSGVLPADNRVPWRNSSCENDGSLNNTDLSGGYYDAGDYIKATYPFCWTMTSIAWSALSFGSAYGRTSQDAYLDSMLRWGLDWLMKANSDANTLWVLVGNPNIDNEYWGGDQNIPDPRPSFNINRENPGTDAFAACAAAFASSAYLYSEPSASLPTSASGARLGGVPSLRNVTYSESLMRHAERLWDLTINTSPKQVYSVAAPFAGSSYPSSDWEDDVAFAGFWMTLAKKDPSYANQGMTYYPNGTNPYASINAALNWDRKVAALPILATQLAQQNSSFGLNMTRFQTDAEAYFDHLTNGQMQYVSQTKGGLYWWEGDSDADSLNPALNAAFIADLYSGFATTSAKTTAYRQLADSQVDYLLGDNNYNGPYIVGQHPNSPQNPHSAMASGGSDINNINNSPPEEAHVIYGAVVGGPDKKDRFFDIRDDWPETEIALDYNAPFIAAAVSRIARNVTQDPPFTTLSGAANVASGLPNDQAYPSKKSGGLSSGAKIAIAIVVIVVVFAAAAGLSWWQRDRIKWFHRQKKMGL
ncbi:probable Family 9 glycosyl hydrolase [Melanopsichium pennsylvanicum]|uniref:Endoglucanase n=2 Tax=Melanopsichium pennsylvanicum TaxID=63383 RepID=A0AAJ4XKJ4_9BASI|nr:probable Family 9 glycosyl hydrolase [Melanopsichium pennsylvanicum 4]SNX84049.1 probable Family 9 glycosyl hydrolase [Melanopsichium pennsylvanicum]